MMRYSKHKGRRDKQGDKKDHYPKVKQKQTKAKPNYSKRNKDGMTTNWEAMKTIKNMRKLPGSFS